MSRLEQLIKIKAPAMSTGLEIDSAYTGFRVRFNGTTIFTNSGLTEDSCWSLEELEDAIGRDIDVFTKTADGVIFAYADFLNSKESNSRFSAVEL